MRQKLVLVMVLALVTFLSVVPLANAQVGGQPWLGEIVLVPYNFAPKGWVFCKGQLLSINENQALFSLLGTFYGGDGLTTFALPDLQGRSPIGAGQGPGLQPYTLGAPGGEEEVTLTVSQMPAHTHTAQGSSGLANQASPGNMVWAAQSLLEIYSSSSDSQMAPGAVGTAGGNQPHDNRSPYLTLNYVIALTGIYPSRN